MRTTAFKYGSLFIGLIAAVIIIFSQSFIIEKTAEKKKAGTTTEAAAESKSESATKLSSQTISATSFPSAAQINFFQEASCLFEILFSHEDTSAETQPIELSLSKFYSIILRVFISPNAP